MSVNVPFILFFSFLKSGVSYCPTLWSSCLSVLLREKVRTISIILKANIPEWVLLSSIPSLQSDLDPFPLKPLFYYVPASNYIIWGDSKYFNNFLGDTKPLFQCGQNWDCLVNFDGIEHQTVTLSVSQIILSLVVGPS